MRWYIASPWVNRAKARLVRSDLLAMGHSVSSAWLDGPDTGSLPNDRMVAISEALADEREVRGCEGLLTLTVPGTEGTGHIAEFGMALILGKFLVVAGPVKSIFHHRADFIFASWEECHRAMREKWGRP